MSQKRDLWWQKNQENIILCCIIQYYYTYNIVFYISKFDSRA